MQKLRRSRISARFFLFSTWIVSFLLSSWPAAPKAGDSTDGLIFSERFEDARTIGKRFTFRGAGLVAAGAWGTSLRVGSGTSAELSPPEAIRAEGGTISFWVRPTWTEDDRRSHTFLSMAWDHPARSYLVLSQGWWESNGPARLYFVVSNQDSMHCSVPRRLQPDAWTMVTAVWSGGKDGSCALYLNGERVAEHVQPFEGRYAGKGPLLFGTDEATTQARGRGADALFDEIALYRRPLSDREVQRLYRAQEKDPEGAVSRKWAWLERGLQRPERTMALPSGARLENRVIFDEDMRWATSREATDRILARVKAAGFNVYVPCVWHGRGTYYATPLAAPEAALSERVRSDDPLAYLVGRAHELGIEVHPWFTVVRREDDRYPEFFDAGTPEDAYDVHRPSFRDFIVALMVDVVRRYDVDGLNLDYIRAMGICTSLSCREDYERTSVSAFWSDYALRAVVGSARTRLERWQDEAVGDIVRRTAAEGKRLKPRLLISVDGYPVPRGAHRALEGRHETAWVNEGSVDVIFAMEYGERVDTERLDAVRRELYQPARLAVLFANYDLPHRGEPAVPRPGALVAKYAAYAQRNWPAHTVAFILFWQMSDEQVFALRRGPFKDPAVPDWPAVSRGPLHG